MFVALYWDEAVRLNEHNFASGVIKQKVADHYFVSLIVFGGALTRNGLIFVPIFDNKNRDILINVYYWKLFISLHHSTAYQKWLNKSEVYVTSVSKEFG